MPSDPDANMSTAPSGGETRMTVDQFWRVLARNAKIGAAVFFACVLGAVVLGVTSPPLYKAATLFQIQAPTDYPTFDIPLLDVSVLQAWLGQADVLARIIDAGGLHGQLTTGQLQASIGVTAAGGPNTFEVTAASFSQARAQRLADAGADVLGTRAVDVVKSELPPMAQGVQDMLARAGALVLAERNAGRQVGSADAFASLRYQAVSKVYRNLQARLMVLRLLQTQGTVRARILIPAGVPAAPATPGRALYGLFGIVAGVILGVTGALVAEAVRGAHI